MPQQHSHTLASVKCPPPPLGRLANFAGTISKLSVLLSRWNVLVFAKPLRGKGSQQMMGRFKQMFWVGV